MKISVLTERADCLFGIIRRYASAGLPTPTGRELSADLKAAGHKPYARAGAVRTYDVVGYEIRALVDAGLLRVHGANSYRVFEIVETKQRTKRRPAARSGLTPAMRAATDRVVAAAEGWPKRAPESYDAAVANREFAKHNMNVKRGPYVVYADRRPEARSLTGCSAEMAAL